MSLAKKGSISLDEFRSAVHNAVSQEPLATRFAKFSTCGDRRGMVEMLMKMPHVTWLKLADSYRSKDDAQAAGLYERSLQPTTQPGDDEQHTEQIGMRNDTLTKALFAASASGRVFLDALCERAKRSYGLRAYTSCLRDCECMLALPASFYNAENVKYFVQRRKECLQLERESSKKLEAASMRKRSHRKASSSSSSSSSCRSSSIAPSPRTPSFGKYCVTTVPVVDGKRHSCLVSCPDSVTLRFDVARGRHLVATRDIRPGAVLIVDRPFSYSTDASALIRNCLHCHATLKLENSVRIPCRNCQTVSFCTETCRKEAWQRYHRYECSVFDYFFESAPNGECQRRSHLLLAYRTTVLQALSVDTSNDTSETSCVLNSDFLRYHANGNANAEDDDISKECADLGTKKPYSPLDYRTVYQLETHYADMGANVKLIRAIEAVFLAKCLIFVLSKLDVVCTKETFVPLAVAMLHHLQAIDCNAYEIIENVHDEATRVWEPRNIGGAIYTTVSLVNHSCYPNVVRHSYPNGMIVVRALRSISKGCEIFDCYGPQFLSESRLTRREFLWKKYRFLCECNACTHNWTFPLPDTINYKCTACSEPLDFSATNASVAQMVTQQQCTKCEKMIDLRKIEKQLHRSIQKRLNAIAKMYEGNYKDAMPLLLEHALFVNKYLAEPNIEGIKTEQCIVQCYNSLGSTSV
ncbi:SET and MYND domain-containing protein 4 [Harpegnathos saltator]|uniref:Protein-lysine N-methyltransferase SMYD4 n=1 Tax=Harpegnathos saltator TaxID=610380 RepID=E2C4E4_HARSA|nr:SET and MYND domain-containing protein 4 [Harpegnathos saltator]EFN77181.1 SET and MYND domain-containing protein 4 [Harpegnathos saltator]